MIAHRLSTVLEADTIFVVKKNGSIVESGNHKHLMELNGYYKELYNGQNAVGVLSSPSMSGFRRTEVRSGAVRHA